MKLITTKNLSDLHIGLLNNNGIKTARVGNNKIGVEIQKQASTYTRYFTNEELIVYSLKIDMKVQHDLTKDIPDPNE